VPRAGSEQASDTADEDPPPALPAPEIEWQRAVTDKAGDYAAVAAWDRGFVVVADKVGDDRVGKVLVSDDGLTWEEVAVGQDAFTTAGHLGQLNFAALVAAEAQILIVGSEVQPDGEDVDGAVWMSSDGRVWERVPDDEGIFGGPGWQGIRAVTWTGDGFVAVGHDTLPDTELSRVAIWNSPNGTHWERLPHDPDSFEADEELTVLSVATGQAGSVVVGRRGTDGAVWYSSDTQIWELLSPMPEVFGGDNKQEVHDVVSGDEGFLAVGYADPGAAAWVSVDGRSWQLVERFDSGSMFAVTAVADGFVGVGVENRSGVLRAASWTSRDGSSWHRIPHDEVIFGGVGNTGMYDAAYSGNTLVAVGFGGIWVGQVDG
jgi:hypothetical protein